MNFDDFEGIYNMYIVYVHIIRCIYVYVYVYIYIYVYVYVHVHVHVYVYVYVYVYVFNIYIHCICRCLFRTWHFFCPWSFFHFASASHCGVCVCV